MHQSNGTQTKERLAAEPDKRGERRYGGSEEKERKAKGIKTVLSVFLSLAPSLIGSHLADKCPFAPPRQCPPRAARGGK